MTGDRRSCAYPGQGAPGREAIRIEVLSQEHAGVFWNSENSVAAAEWRRDRIEDGNRESGLDTRIKSKILTKVIFTFSSSREEKRISFPCNKLPQTEELKTTQIYYLTVPVGQESGHGTAGFSAQSLARLKSRCQHGLWSHLRLGILFLSHSGCWQN